MDSNGPEKIIEELQMLEHNLQNLLAQKQMFLVELQESANALKELKETKDEVYRILSGIMLKTDKDTLVKELEEKKKITELRITSIERQESVLQDKSIKLRQKVVGSIDKDGKNENTKKS